jgi:glycosyltransferase involved in cell wall biosynthesis
MTSTPVLTIGIPTYNRADFLRRSLRSAASQTGGPLAVLVSDNASADDTREVVGQFPEVRYFRNDTNLGMAANWERLVRICDTEYFAFLQDDDLLFQNFAQRALGRLREHPQAAAYLCYSMVTPSERFASWLYGPPFPLDWQGGNAAVFDGRIVAPFSLLLSVGNPPVIVFRTDILRDCWDVSRFWEHPLYWERSILSLVAAQGPVVVDPCIGGIFRDHADQCWKNLSKVSTERQRDWEVMATIVDGLVCGWTDDWKDAFLQTLNSMDSTTVSYWAKQTATWPRQLNLCETVRTILDSFSDGQSSTMATARNGSHGSRVDLAKRALHDMTPPILWRLARRLKNAVHTRP